jgi:multiple sugar transport system permease protein
VSDPLVTYPEDGATVAAPSEQQRQRRGQRSSTARQKRKSDLASALAFLSPTLLVLSAFVFFPVVFSFYLSFHTWNMFSSTEAFVGLGNYSAIVQNAEFWQVLKNTAIYTLGTVPLNMLISLGIAFFLNKKLVGKKFLRTAFFAPVIMSSVAAAVIWRWVYEPSFGLLNYFLSWFGIPAVNWLNNPTSAMFALIAMGVWKSFGFNMVLFSAGLQGIPDHYYEAAQIDGAGKWRQFWNITVPLLSPTTFFVLVMSVIGSFQVFDTVYVLTSGGPLGSTKVLVFYLYEQAFKFFDMGYASAVAYLLFAVVFILTILQMKYLRGSVHYTS